MPMSICDGWKVCQSHKPLKMRLPSSSTERCFTNCLGKVILNIQCWEVLSPQFTDRIGMRTQKLTFKLESTITGELETTTEVHSSTPVVFPHSRDQKIALSNEKQFHLQECVCTAVMTVLASVHWSMDRWVVVVLVVVVVSETHRTVQSSASELLPLTLSECTGSAAEGWGRYGDCRSEAELRLLLSSEYVRHQRQWQKQQQQQLGCTEVSSSSCSCRFCRCTAATVRVNVELLF